MVFGKIIENVSSKSLCSAYFESNNNYIFLTLDLEEKKETENKVQVIVKKSNEVNDDESLNLTNALQEILTNILIDKMEKTKVILKVYILAVSEKYCVYMDVMNCLSILALRSGLPLRDVLCSYSSKDIKISYYLNENSIANLSIGKADNSDIIKENMIIGVEKSINEGENIKKYFTKS